MHFGGPRRPDLDRCRRPSSRGGDIRAVVAPPKSDRFTWRVRVLAAPFSAFAHERRSQRSSRPHTQLAASAQSSAVRASSCTRFEARSISGRRRNGHRAKTEPDGLGRTGGQDPRRGGSRTGSSGCRGNAVLGLLHRPQQSTGSGAESTTGSPRDLVWGPGGHRRRLHYSYQRNPARFQRSRIPSRSRHARPAASAVAHRHRRPRVRRPASASGPAHQ